MFGIGFSEILFILVIVLMLFGSKEIPNFARVIGKTMAQLKHATNEIKSEIQHSAKENGVDVNSLTGGINEEISKAKEGLSKALNPMNEIKEEIEKPVQKVQEDIEDLTGPIKRQM